MPNSGSRDQTDSVALDEPYVSALEALSTDVPLLALCATPQRSAQETIMTIPALQKLGKKLAGWKPAMAQYIAATFELMPEPPRARDERPLPKGWCCKGYRRIAFQANRANSSADAMLKAIEDAGLMVVIRPGDPSWPKSAGDQGAMRAPVWGVFLDAARQIGLQFNLITPIDSNRTGDRCTSDPPDFEKCTGGRCTSHANDAAETMGGKGGVRALTSKVEKEKSFCSSLVRARAQRTFSFEESAAAQLERIEANQKGLAARVAEEVVKRLPVQAITRPGPAPRTPELREAIRLLNEVGVNTAEECLSTALSRGWTPAQVIEELHRIEGLKSAAGGVSPFDASLIRAHLRRYGDPGRPILDSAFREDFKATRNAQRATTAQVARDRQTATRKAESDRVAQEAATVKLAKQEAWADLELRFGPELDSIIADGRVAMVDAELTSFERSASGTWQRQLRLKVLERRRASVIENDS